MTDCRDCNGPVQDDLTDFLSAIRGDEVLPKDSLSNDCKWVTLPGLVEVSASSTCCRRCSTDWECLTRMVLCPTCGNKRCPRATDHENACTGSNAPGQPGSDY